MRIFLLFFTIKQAAEAIDVYWNSDHAEWDNFRLVPYPTVKRLIDNLDDDLYNTLPSQPPPRPPEYIQQQLQKAKATASATASTSASGPAEDPLEEQSVWCEILKLEGRVSNNKKADGFSWWLDKNLDSVVYEVTIYILINHEYLNTGLIYKI